jgi:hypothetical protein
VSFADRVIRKRIKAGLVKPREFMPTDPGAMAAEHLDMSWGVEEAPVGYPRASGLQNACMRFHVIGARTDKKVKQFNSLRDKLCFGIGRSVQEWIQNTPDVLGDKRRGWWRCVACNKVLYFGAPPKKPCKYCGARAEAILYHEHYMKLPEPWMITGHPDMWLEPNPGIFQILEIKTIKDEEFDKIKAPLVQHDWQLQSYMWGCELDDRLPITTDPTIGFVMYVSKRYSTKELPYKMFTVHRNDSLVMRIKNKVMAFSDGYLHYPEKLPPPHDECLRGSMSSYRAKTCVCKTECFAFYSEGK